MNWKIFLRTQMFFFSLGQCVRSSSHMESIVAPRPAATKTYYTSTSVIAIAVASALLCTALGVGICLLITKSTGTPKKSRATGNPLLAGIEEELNSSLHAAQRASNTFKKKQRHHETALHDEDPVPTGAGAAWTPLRELL